MVADYIEIDGKRMRVEGNWNAICDFLAERGKDTFDGLVGMDKITPGDIAPLMAACIREGERLDGRPCSLSSKDIGAMPGMMAKVPEFMEIFSRQSAPQGAVSEEKKTEAAEG